MTSLSPFRADLAPTAYFRVLSVGVGLPVPMWSPPPAFSWVDLGQESGSAVKGGECEGGGGRLVQWGGQVLPHCNNISQELARLPQCKAASGGAHFKNLRGRGLWRGLGRMSAWEGPCCLCSLHPLKVVSDDGCRILKCRVVGGMWPDQLGFPGVGRCHSPQPGGMYSRKPKAGSVNCSCPAWWGVVGLMSWFRLAYRRQCPSWGCPIKNVMPVWVLLAPRSC